MTTSNQEFTSYFRIIARRWWLILLLPLVTAVVIYALSSSTQPDYLASVRLQIFPVDPQEISLYSQARFVASDEQAQAVHDDFFDVLRLNSVAWRTIADLGLNLSAKELIERIDSQHTTDFISVSARMPSPELAQQVATRHVENALISYRNIRSKPAQISLNFIETQLQEQEQILAAAQESLQKFQLENEVGDLDREIAAYQDLWRGLRTDRDRATVEAERYERLAAEFRDLVEANITASDALMVSAILPTPTPEPVETTEEVPEEAGAGEVVIEPTTKPDLDPAIVAEAQDTLALARAQRRTAEEHNATAQGHRAAAAEYNRVLDERQQELIYLLGLQENHEKLLNTLAEAQGTYVFLTDKANEGRLKLSQGKNVGYLQVTDPARLPNAAVPKRTSQLLLVGIVISLLVAVILAFVLEVLENSLNRPEPMPPTPDQRA